MQKPRHSQGVTLIEVLFVLFVMVAIVVGGAKSFQQVNMGEKVNEAAKMVQLIWVGAENYANQHCDPNDQYCVYPVDIISELIRNGSLASKFDEDHANPWGGKVTAKFVFDKRDNVINGVHIEMNAIPNKNVCQRLYRQLSSVLSIDVQTPRDVPSYCRSEHGYTTIAVEMRFNR